MKRLRLAAQLLTILAVAWPMGAGQGTSAKFPGVAESLTSPGGERFVRWVAPTAGAGDHRLLLGVAGGRIEGELLRFPRSVEVFWSPSGQHLAVTNHFASDEGTVLLWEALPGMPRDLLEELAEHEGQGRARWKAHHLYLEAVGWESDQVLRLRLWGYGDSNMPALNRRYRLVFGEGFSRE